LHHLQTAPRAQGRRGIYYRAGVLSEALVGRNWCAIFPETVVIWENERRADCSLNELLGKSLLTLALWERPTGKSWPAIKRHPSEVTCSNPILSLADVPDFGKESVHNMLASMQLTEVEREDDLWLLTFSTDLETRLFRPYSEKKWYVTEFPSNYGRLEVDTGVYRQKCIVFRRSHPVVDWLLRLSTSAAASNRFDHTTIFSLWEIAAESWFRLDDVLEKWHSDESVPDELRPPRVKHHILQNTELIGRLTL
jgi:hypothetical protein